MPADRAPASAVSCIKNLNQGGRTYSLLVTNSVVFRFPVAVRDAGGSEGRAAPSEEDAIPGSALVAQSCWSMKVPWHGLLLRKQVW